MRSQNEVIQVQSVEIKLKMIKIYKKARRCSGKRDVSGRNEALYVD